MSACAIDGSPTGDGSLPVCVIDGCTGTPVGRRLCNRHWKRMKDAGRLQEFPLVSTGPKPVVPCSIDGCARPRLARGWCGTHYWRWQQHGDPTVLVFTPTKTCTVEGCDKPHRLRGMCEMHFGRWTRRGSVELRPTGIDAFHAQAVPGPTPSDCWTWTGSVNNHGYGRLGTKYAHRVSYETHHGPIPPGMEVMHTCDNPPCCNPQHLKLGTHAENMADAGRKGRVGGNRRRG